MSNNSSDSIKMKFAVMSDLHCHHSQKFGKDTKGKSPESYLITDNLRFPSKKHPIQSLLDLIEEDTEGKIKSDYLLCPGDITNQVDKQGFISGWDYVQEVGGVLGVKETIATLGNHDVDSRYNVGDDVFMIAKAIGNGFPLATDQLRKDFWANGFCFVENPNLRVLVINTVQFHTMEQLTVKGEMDELQLENIDKYLNGKDDGKIQIALCHHHPIDHSKLSLGSEDTIKLGDQLLEVLDKYHFDLLVHGHKHHAWLRYGNGYKTPVFSSGSFSATSNHYITGAHNTFHIITIIKNKKERASGYIKTWEYLPSQGWRLAESGEQFLPVFTGFGFIGEVETLVKQAEKLISEASNQTFIKWSDFIEKIKDVNYLTPEQLVDFKKKLKEKEIVTHPELPKLPEFIGKLFS